MVIGRIRFLASTIAPKPEEIEYWIDLSEDRYGCVIKCYNGVEWERIDQRTYDEIISFKHKLDELLIEIQECENDLLQHKEDFEEYKNETDSSLNAINEQIEDINASLETLLGESASEFIDKYNEILNFLTGYEDTDTLQSILSDLKNEISQNITEIESNLTSHINNKNNPHQVTKEQIGLSNVDNTADVDKPISTATQSAIDAVKEEINTHINNKDNPHNVTVEQIGAIPTGGLKTINGNSLEGEGNIVISSSGSGESSVLDLTEIPNAFTTTESTTISDELYSKIQEAYNNGVKLCLISGYGDTSTKTPLDIMYQEGGYILNIEISIFIGGHYTKVTSLILVQSASSVAIVSNMYLFPTSFDVSNNAISLVSDDGVLDCLMKGYSKPSSYSAITEFDSISKAIGKLEAGLVEVINIPVDESGVGKIDQNSDGTGEIFNDYDNNYATGIYSHAENYHTSASGNKSHAEGDSTIASGSRSHVEGYLTQAIGKCSHAEGQVDLKVEAPFFSKTRKLKIYRSSSQYVGYVDDSSEFQFILSAGELFKHNNTIYKVKKINYNDKLFSTSPNIVDNIELSNDYSAPTEITIESVTKLGSAIGGQSHHEGTNNCAYGTNSHVRGNGCQAIGNNSFAHGENLIVGDGQTVFGKYNLYNEDDIFQIGYGIDGYKGRSNALSVSNDGVTTASYIKTYGITVSDKLILYNNITIGSSSTNQITSASKGLIITSRGYNKITNDGASGDTTYLVIGESNNVSGRNFLVAGDHNDASRTYSNNSICVGLHNTICDSQSITVGYNCIAYGNATVAFGGGGIILTIEDSYSATSLLQLYESTYNQHDDSIHVAFAKQSMVTGKNNLALGLQSMSNGQGNVAKNDQEFVVGSFNDYSSDTNNLFVVGNGTSHTSRGNAFVVTRDGVQNSSDINLKDNITDLKPKGELRLVEFDWKNTGRHSYGFIAQEVEQIYPEMVSDNGQHKMLNYNEAICAKIAELQNRIVELEKLIQK